MIHVCMCGWLVISVCKVCLMVILVHIKMHQHVVLVSSTSYMPRFIKLHKRWCKKKTIEIHCFTIKQNIPQNSFKFARQFIINFYTQHRHTLTIADIFYASAKTRRHTFKVRHIPSHVPVISNSVILNPFFPFSRFVIQPPHPRPAMPALRKRGTQQV